MNINDEETVSVGPCLQVTPDKPHGGLTDTRGQAAGSTNVKYVAKALNNNENAVKHENQCPSNRDQWNSNKTKGTATTIDEKYL